MVLLTVVHRCVVDWYQNCDVTKIYFCKQQKIPNTVHMTVGIQQPQIYTWGI